MLETRLALCECESSFSPEELNAYRNRQKEAYKLDRKVAMERFNNANIKNPKENTKIHKSNHSSISIHWRKRLLPKRIKQLLPST